LLAAIVCVASTGVMLSDAEAALDATEIAVRARLGFDAPQAAGTVEIHWRNLGPAPSRTAAVFLFANRFESIAGLDHLARHFLLAGGTFDPGATEIVAVTEAGRSLAWNFQETAGLPPKTVAAIDLGRELGKGDEARVTIEFRTRLPNLLDTFGATGNLVVADGGWYPQPLAGDGCPAGAVSSQTHARLSSAPGSFLLVNGKASAGDGSVELDLPGNERVSAVLSRRQWVDRSWRIGQRAVHLYSVPSDELANRVSRNPSPEDALVDAVTAVLADSNQEGDQVVVRLPLHWYPSAAAPGMVLVSDRLFELFPILRPLHERDLAYALFLEEELAAAARREPPVDARWVAEGLAWRRAEKFYQGRFRERREVKDWIRALNVFAIVDRFETSPRMPLVRPFFPVTATDDPLRIRMEGVCAGGPPGRLLFDKLEAKLRPERFAAALERYLSGHEPMRVALSGGDDLGRFIETWRRPYAAVDYALADVELNPGGRSGARFTIERESREPRPDTVAVALEEAAGEETEFVDLAGESTTVTRSTPAPVRALAIDPDRRTIETRLDNNRVPGRYQLMLDNADIEVSSTEFGVAGLLVGRRRYDYQKDLGLAGFYTSRGYGFDAGFQLHGGPPIDANLYRHNLFAYYTLEQLDSSFQNKQAPDVRTRGRLSGFGLRFNSYDAFWFQNPAGSHHLRLFFDGFDRALGGDFGYVQGGGSLAYTLALRPDTVVAGQVLNGYSAATGRGPVPNQGLFSLGGFRSIRGIGAKEELGKDIFVVRAELRHMLPWRLDWNLEDMLIARRLQAKLFVDAGRVEGSSRRLYDPSGFAVGVGGGLNLFYDFMGFFPTTFYLDVATRADEASAIQLLFGVGQPF
jgi:hypothetical protein